MLLALACPEIGQPCPETLEQVFQRSLYTGPLAPPAWGGGFEALPLHAASPAGVPISGCDCQGCARFPVLDLRSIRWQGVPPVMPV